MMNITYGKKPSPNQSLDELVDLLKVSNYCGAIAAKLHAEESLSKLTEIANCAMLGDLSCTLVCPLLLEACGKVFVANPAEVMKSEGWKTAKSNNDVLQYFMEVQNKIVNSNDQSVADLRSKLMEAGCVLVDLDGDLLTLEKNLRRLTEAPAPPSKKQKTGESSSSAA
jgi:hypothetical protein